MTAATPATRGVPSHGTLTETDARAQNDNGKKNVIGWVRGSARRDSHCWNLRKTWMNANARAQNSEREKMFMGG